MKRYQPQEFETYLIAKWNKDKTYKADLSKGKKKMYILDMFPYPSGTGLHVGHPRGYTATDILSRYYRMRGYAVLHPMGWDAFGLPAENAAIKVKTNPKKIVPKNIENFKRQMQMLGFSYDWTLELATTDPDYYKWTQWLFIEFFKMGLLTKKMTPINYCPTCKTGLAEEEVLPDGTHERCGTKITKKELPQWIFRITTYADRLLSDLKDLGWPSGILEMQKNWIGRKEGININYKVKGKREHITCFTTRPDTNFGATFIVLAPEHDFITKVINGAVKVKISAKQRKGIEEYVKKTASKSELERIAEGRKKTGVFTGLYAVNNLNERQMPIWISDFVLKDFGTGAVVGVPGHDIRDFEFASEFGIKVIRVVVGKDGDRKAITRKKQVQEEEGTMVNSGFLNGMDIHAATKKIMDYLEKKGWGKPVVTYHLRDWVFSRQRYWGEPIPMVYFEKCAKNKVSYWDPSRHPDGAKRGKDPVNEILRFAQNDQNVAIKKRIKEVSSSLHGWFPLSEKKLPLELPDVENYEPLETGESPLAAISTFVKTTCPNCGGDARRETDTMPNWAGSCWYFIRFAQNQNSKIKIHKSDFPSRKEWDAMMKGTDKWMPVDWYVGGAEHAVLHLLYARFWMKAMHDIGLVSQSEPFMRLRNVGMILAEDHRKMSKSWGNVINPDEVVAEFGADALRVYEMFMAPFSQEIAWSTRTLQGSYRFLTRIWRMYEQYSSDIKSHSSIDLDDSKLQSELHKTIEKVGSDIESIKYNTAVAAMMEFLNSWEDKLKDQIVKSKGKSMMPLSRRSAKLFLKILAPFAPFMTEIIWQDIFGEKSSIHLAAWPEVDKKLLKEENVTIPVQVNGKIRTTIIFRKSESDEKTVVKKAIEDEKVKKYINGKKYKAIYVKGKILNLVVH